MEWRDGGVVVAVVKVGSEIDAETKRRKTSRRNTKRRRTRCVDRADIAFIRAVGVSHASDMSPGKVGNGRWCGTGCNARAREGRGTHCTVDDVLDV